ncbi:MAG: class II histone deacetylase [Pseudorhodoplanes sp.]
MATGFSWHELFAWHDAGRFAAPFVEMIEAMDSPETKRRFRNLVEVSGLLDKLVPIPPREATDEEILRAHSAAHLARIARVSDSEIGGKLGRLAHIGPGGLKIARLAAGAAIETVDAVLDGRVANAYALVRPAGHHASREASMGFCILNNVAIAARHAIAVRGLSRVAIIDWDVHWGNGTQSIFWTDPSVLAISLHQDELLSVDGGYVEEVGEGAGRGATLNIPLPPGSGHAAYVAAFDRVVLPALDRFRPDLIIIASGLDALSADTFGRMNLHSESYRVLTRRLMDKAERLCSGRLMMCHEGGYSAMVVPFAGLAIMETLSGLSTSVSDPFLQNVRRQKYQALADQQAAAIARAADVLPLIPSPA